MYSVYVEDFMVRDVKYIWHGMSYGKLKEVLKENRNLRSFPLVDNPGMCTIFAFVYNESTTGSYVVQGTIWYAMLFIISFFSYSSLYLLNSPFVILFIMFLICQFEAFLPSTCLSLQ
jgi:hypothetical protein